MSGSKREGHGGKAGMLEDYKRPRKADTMKLQSTEGTRGQMAKIRECWEWQV